MIESSSNKFTKHISKMQKFPIIIMGIIVAISTPFFIYESWVSSMNDISMQTNIPEETAYNLRSYMVSHIGLTSITIFSILLLLVIFYFLISKNEKLQKSQVIISESEANHRLITENISDLISKHSLDGKYTYLSPSSKSILGYEPEELLGKTPACIIHPDSMERAIESYNKILQKKDIDVTTYKIRRKDDYYIWMEIVNKAIRDPETNEPVEILCVARDITKKKDEENLFKKMISYTEELLQTGTKQVKYQQIIENLLYISKAKFGALTLLNENTGIYTTEAIAGNNDSLDKIFSIIGYDLIGKEWKDYSYKNEDLKGQIVTYFPSLSALSKKVIPVIVSNKVEKILGFGEASVIKIIVDGQMIGDFTLIMPEGKSFENEYFIEIYSRQINLFMTRLKSEEMLKASESRLLSAQSLARVGNWELNISTKELWASKEAFNIYGIKYNPTSLPLDLVQKSVFPEYRERLDNALIGLLKRNEIYDEKFKVLNSLTGETLFIHSKAIRMDDSKGNPIKITGAIQDITDYKKSEEEILYLSFHDQLTGLYNRRFYEEKLLKLDNESNLPITIVMGDVNGLKLINDSFGHVMGDGLLKKAANAIKYGCRETDITARLGGDEFVIIMPKTDAIEAEKIISRIKKLTSEEKIGVIDISISFGMETKTRIEEDIQEILKETEDHMYRNKLNESSSMRSKTIALIMNTLYEKNNREMLHSKRVGELCAQIATRMNFDEDDINQIKIAGLMHDIGKIGINETILNNPNKLIKDEWREVERHSEIGYRILSSVNEFSEIAEYVLEHHEKLDGTGYPRGLKGDEISLQARIITMADSYDAITNDRPYREAMTNVQAILEIKRCTGTQFDPEIAKIFIDMIS